MVEESPTPTKQWSRAEILSAVAIILSALSFLFGPGILAKFSPPVVHVEPTPVKMTGVAHFEGIISIVNIVLAATVLINIYKSQKSLLKTQQPRSPLAATALAQFLSGWFWVWTTWVLLYGWLAVVWLKPLYVEHRVWPWIVADFLNMLNGCFMFLLFLVLDLPSVKNTENTAQSPPRDARFRKYVRITFGVGFLLFVVETLTILVRQQHTNSPDVLLKNLVAAFTAVGMAFFIGRLDSHYLKAPRIVLVPLYLYVVLQLSWNNITGSDAAADDPTRTIILGLACYFKFLLFWVVRAWLTDGSIERYLEAAERYSSTQTNQTA